jgi:hypothetical protein
VINLPPLQLGTAFTNNGRFMSPHVTVALLALGLGLQLVFLGFLFFDTHAGIQAHRRAAVLACAVGFLGTCIIGVLAFLRHDVVLLVGEVLAMLTGAVLLYRMTRSEMKSSRDRDEFFA